MGQRTRLLSILVLATLSCTIIRATEITGKLTILGPESLRDKYSGQDYQIDVAVANYGYVPYGGGIRGVVRSGEDLIGADGCGKTDKDGELLPPNGSLKNKGHDNLIVMVERGQCYFSDKSINVQSIGGSVAMVLDDREENTKEHIMIGDNPSVDIPSILVPERPSEEIKRAMENHEEVELYISFPIPHPDNEVELELFLLSSNIEMMQFVAQFYTYARHLGDHLKLTPEYVIYYCPNCEQNGYKEPEVDCVSNGRYCAPDPDLEERYTGFDIVIENLRQMCVYEHGIANNRPYMWWDYVSKFYETCMAPNLKDYERTHIAEFKDFSTDCANKILAKVGMIPEEIEECITRSFTPAAETDEKRKGNDNKKLMQAAETQKADGVYYHPLVRVNGKNIHGTIDKSFVMNAVCSGLRDVPEVCTIFWNHDNTEHAVRTDTKTTTHVTKKPGMKTSTIILIILACVSFALVLLFCIKRKMAMDMNQQINNELHHVVSQYQTLGDDPKKAERRSLVHASRV